MDKSGRSKSGPAFNAQEKEQQLKAESESWDTNQVADAQANDIPVIDLTDYFSSGDRGALRHIAAQLKVACEEVGFFSIIGHQIPATLLDTTFQKVREFHDLPLELKKSIQMDRPEWPVGGAGYLPVKNRKLPARATGNVNEAFIIKCSESITMEHNQWPDHDALPGFRSAVEVYAMAMEALAKKMLPVYATALDMPPSFFNDAFISPLYRLRMTHYPPSPATDEFGIAPHVDTSFCTILAQDQPGLTIYSERRKAWIKVPLLENAFVVNTGELLKQWTNDSFLSVKHFANNNTSAASRYSIPFFFNANEHYKMTCVPSCCSADNPSRYPPISYAQSQATVQGE